MTNANILIWMTRAVIYSKLLRGHKFQCLRRSFVQHSYVLLLFYAIKKSSPPKITAMMTIIVIVKTVKPVPRLGLYTPKMKYNIDKMSCTQSKEHLVDLQLSQLIALSWKEMYWVYVFLCWHDISSQVML